MAKNPVCGSCRFYAAVTSACLVSAYAPPLCSIRQTIVVGSLATHQADTSRGIVDTRQQASLLSIPHSLLLPVGLESQPMYQIVRQRYIALTAMLRRRDDCVSSSLAAMVLCSGVATAHPCT